MSRQPTEARVLLLSAVEPCLRPDTDLSSVVSSVHRALRQRPGTRVVHEEITTLAEGERAVRQHRPDVVFNACETLGGKSADEPLVPLMLERLGVELTGNTGRALHRCLRKGRATDALRAAGVLVPATFREGDTVPADAYPLIVKPECEDGSVGIDGDSVVHDEPSLRRLFRALADEGRPAIAQRYIEGREIAVAFLGWPEPRVLPPGEILYDEETFAGRARVLTYASKWDESSEDYGATRSVGAVLTPELSARITAATRRAVRALGMRDYGRVDFRVDADGHPHVIDANPNCDLSSDGGFMRAAARAGMTYADAIDAIVTAALQRVDRASALAPRRAAG